MNPACRCENFADPLLTLDDVSRRCRAERVIGATLEQLAADDDRWLAVLRCRVCGRLWAMETPFGEMHGGGPDCYYQIATPDPERWLASAAPLASRIVREAAEGKREPGA